MRVEMISHGAGDVVKTGLPQHGIVEQALHENHFRIPPDLLPCVQATLGRAAPQLAKTSSGDNLGQSGSRHRHDHSRSSNTGSCWDPPGSLVCDRSAADTVPSIDRGSVVGSAANHELADSPVEESAVS